MDATEFFGVLVVPVIIGLVEVAKGTGLSARWAAPLALVLGLGLSLIAADDGITMAGAVMRGLALGLSASGLYAAVNTQLSAAQRRPAAGVRARVRSSRRSAAAAGRVARGDE
ncbi:MAG: hypothetical protein ACKVVP_10475 [Chloroflexota bacterium]